MFARSCRSAVTTLHRCLRFNSTTSAPPSSQRIGATSPSLPRAPDLTEPAYAATVVRGRSLRPPHYLPKTHGIPAATLHFRSYHQNLLDFFVHFAGHAAAALGIPISKPVHLPTERRLWTVLRGPFVHKKSQENFERRTHKRVLKAWDAHPAAVELLVQYLEKHIAAGVGMRAVRWTRAPVGVGAKTMEAVKGQLRVDKAGVSAEKVKALGEQIVKEELKAAGAATSAEGAVEKAAPASS